MCNYTPFETHENLIEQTGSPEIERILKEYVIEQELPKHRKKQQIRVEIGRKLDEKGMPGDLTHKILTEHFGGKTRRKKGSKKKGVTKSQKSKKERRSIKKV